MYKKLAQAMSIACVLIHCSHASCSVLYCQPQH